MKFSNIPSRLDTSSLTHGLLTEYKLQANRMGRFVSTHAGKISLDLYFCGNYVLYFSEGRYHIGALVKLEEGFFTVCDTEYNLHAVRPFYVAESNCIELVADNWLGHGDEQSLKDAMVIHDRLVAMNEQFIEIFHSTDIQEGVIFLAYMFGRSTKDIKVLLDNISRSHLRSHMWVSVMEQMNKTTPLLKYFID